LATILLVDDVPANGRQLAALLGNVGHRVLEAADGAEALAVARARHPDLAIVDIVMPTMDGQEFVRRLRAERSLADLPVVFCTATYSEHEAHRLAQACGVLHLLTKPSDPERILDVVHDALGLPPPSVPSRVPPAALTTPLAQDTEQLRMASLRLAALLELHLEVAGEHDPLRLLESFCCGARKLIGSRYAAVGLLKEGTSAFQDFFTSGMTAPVAYAVGASPTDVGLLGRVFTEHGPVRAENLPEDPVAAGLPAVHPSIRSFLGVPLASPTRVYGLVYLGDKLGDEVFNDEDERLAITLAAQLAIAYENARRYDDLRRFADRLQHEVVERRRAEQELRQSEALLEKSQELARLGSWSRDLGADNRIEWSKETYRLFGIREGAFDGRVESLESMVHPDDRQAMRDAIQNTLRGEAAYEIEHRIVRSDGKILWVAEQADVIRDGAGRPLRMIGTVQDITQRKQLEEQLRQAQKMEAVGRLAGGIAHDFNNMLGVIMGYGALLLRHLPPDESQRHHVLEIQKATERATSLTRQLLAFSRKQVLQPRLLNVNSVVADMEKMLRRVISEDVQLLTVMQAGLDPVKADPGHLEQVLMNLALNARDAMPKGGKLTISTEDVDLHDIHAAERAGVRPGPYVALTVTDTGIGMDSETRARVFEPFFTTKEAGKGTGLGLATAYGIVRQSEGNIAVSSEPGRGTAFRIYLPCVDEPAPPTLHATSQGEIPRGSETILLAEDEEGVRALAREILEGLGYRVLEAASGPAALDCARGHPGSIQLLLTDVVMPRMSGRELARTLTSLRPETRVLYMSGYPDDATLHDGLEPDFSFLQKPFAPDELARKIRDILDGPRH